jgi:hypothetical protein
MMKIDLCFFEVFSVGLGVGPVKRKTGCVPL